MRRLVGLPGLLKKHLRLFMVTPAQTTARNNLSFENNFMFEKISNGVSNPKSSLKYYIRVYLTMAYPRRKMDSCQLTNRKKRTHNLVSKYYQIG